MNNRELHYRYGISYLVVIIVAAIGFGLFDVPDLVDKVSFSLTITSLVLGVVAIIYTFIAGNKQETQLSTLIETNYSISSASKDIQVAAAAISDQVGVIPPRLDQLDSKLDVLSQGALATLPPPAVPVAAPEQPFDLVQFKEFLTKLPYAGMAALYLFQRAKDEAIKIDEDLTKQISDIPFHYYLGVFNGSDAAGLIDFNFKDGVITPTSSVDVFEKNIYSELNRIIEIVEKDKKNGKESAIKRLKESVDRIIPKGV